MLRGANNKFVFSKQTNNCVKFVAENVGRQGFQSQCDCLRAARSNWSSVGGGGRWHNMRYAPQRHMFSSELSAFYLIESIQGQRDNVTPQLSSAGTLHGVAMFVSILPVVSSSLQRE